jgi:hypothetical protein
MISKHAVGGGRFCISFIINSQNFAGTFNKTFDFIRLVIDMRALQGCNNTL